jgi:hypothetical protein
MAARIAHRRSGLAPGGGVLGGGVLGGGGSSSRNELEPMPLDKLDGP